MQKNSEGPSSSDPPSSAAQNNSTALQNENQKDVSTDPSKSLSQSQSHNVSHHIRQKALEFGRAIKVWFFSAFKRDFQIYWMDLLVLMMRGGIFTSLLSFLIAGVDQGLPYYEFTSVQSIIIYTVGAVTILFGGIFVDAVIKRHLIFEKVAIFGIIAMLLMIYTTVPFIALVSAIFLSFIAFFLTVIFFTLVLSRTSILNRARVISSIIFFIVLSSAPIIVFASQIGYTFSYNWIPPLCLVVFIWIIKRRIPTKPALGQIKTSEILSISNFFRLLRETSTLSYFIFLFLISSVLGFYVSSFGDYITETTGIIIIVIVGILSFLIIGAILDNLGRKSIVYLTLLIVGGLSLFFDYPESVFYSGVGFQIRFIIFIIAAILILILTPVLAGDIASVFSRGRVMSFYLFATVGGTLLGAQINMNFVSSGDLVNREFLIIISDWVTLLIIFALIFISQARETFEESTPNWRLYLSKMYVIFHTGVSIFAFDFKNPQADHKLLNEDLVSGGIMGILQMLKEISQSNRSIQVLDHGDMKLVFHYGKYTQAVLFVEKDLVVFREKLALFHENFENANRDLLEKFFGNVSKMRDVNELRKRYFE